MSLTQWRVLSYKALPILELSSGHGMEMQDMHAEASRYNNANQRATRVLLRGHEHTYVCTLHTPNEMKHTQFSRKNTIREAPCCVRAGQCTLKAFFETKNVASVLCANCPSMAHSAQPLLLRSRRLSLRAVKHEGTCLAWSLCALQ